MSLPKGGHLLSAPRRVPGDSLQSPVQSVSGWREKLRARQITPGGVNDIIYIFAGGGGRAVVVSD